MCKRCYLLAAALALAGCDALTFSPDGEPFTDVDPTVEPLVVDLAAPDTIGMWGTVSLQLQYAGRRADRLEVYLGGELVAEAADQETVAVDSRRVPDGEQPIRLRALASSRTGSLADRLGSEVVVAEAEGVAIVDNAPIEPAAVSAGVTEGVLALAWAPYTRYHFDGFVVQRAAWRESSGQYDSWETVHETADARLGAWADSSYLGGTVGYRVAIRARGETVYSEPVRAGVPVPARVEATPLGDGQVRVVWNQTPLYGVFAGYRLAQQGGLFSEAFDAVDDTVAVVRGSSLFAYSAGYTLTTLGRVPGTSVGAPFRVYADPASPFASGGPGLGGDQPGGPKWPPVVGMPNGTVLGVGAETEQPTLVDASTLEPLAVASLPTSQAQAVRAFAVSPSGRVAVVAARHGTNGPVTIYELDPVTLDVVRTVNPAQWGAGALDAEWGRVAFASDGVLVLGVASGYDPDGAVPDLVAVDLDTGTLAGRLYPGADGGGAGSARSPVALSGDGRLLIVGAENDLRLYERDASVPEGYRFVDRLDPSVATARFLSPTRLAVLTTSNSGRYQARVLGVPSFERVARLGEGLSYGRLSSLSVDRASGRVLVLDASEPTATYPYSGRVRVFDGATAEQVESFRALLWRYQSGTEPEVSLAAGAVWNRGFYRRLP
jgi:hypothetical protein